jgi:hypothetical protein
MFAKLFGKSPKPSFVHLAPVIEMYNKLNFPAANGCAVSDIQALEKKLDQPFPAAYFEFLAWMGNGAGTFLEESRCFFRHAATLKRDAIELLQENNFPESLPPDATAVWMHQGYQFLFITAGEGDNPPVHWYHERLHSTDFEFRQYPSFVEFLTGELAGHACLEEAITGAENGIRKLLKEPVSVHIRDMDAELKCLNELCLKLGNSPLQNGSIKVTSESRVCVACRFALKQFKDKFPNITVDVETIE